MINSRIIAEYEKYRTKHKVRPSRLYLGQNEIKLLKAFYDECQVKTNLSLPILGMNIFEVADRSHLFVGGEL